MLKQIKDFLIIGVYMILVDLVYLRTIAGDFGKMIKRIQKSDMTFNMLGAVLCYIFLVLGIQYFIINKNAKYLDAFLLGMVIYGVFETTSYALLKNWSFKYVVVDTIWGGILFTLTTYLYRKIGI